MLTAWKRSERGRERQDVACSRRLAGLRVSRAHHFLRAAARVLRGRRRGGWSDRLAERRERGRGGGRLARHRRVGRSWKQAAVSRRRERAAVGCTCVNVAFFHKVGESVGWRSSGRKERPSVKRQGKAVRTHRRKCTWRSSGRKEVPSSCARSGTDAPGTRRRGTAVRGRKGSVESQEIERGLAANGRKRSVEPQSEAGRGSGTISPTHRCRRERWWWASGRRSRPWPSCARRAIAAAMARTWRQWKGP